MIETLLEVRNLSKTFRYRTGWFRRQTVEAVKPLSFTLREGQTLAIIGENGSGKSTLAKMLAGMIEPTSGELLIDDHPLHFGDYSFRSQRIRNRNSVANRLLKRCVWLGCYRITSVTIRICWHPGKNSVWVWRAR